MSERRQGEEAAAGVGTLRMYTQHNFFFGMRLTLIAAGVVGVALWLKGDFDGDSDGSFVGVGLLVACAAIGPVLGAIFFAKQGPLEIDPVAQTLTYRRHVFPFTQLGLVRVGSAETLFPSITGIEAGSPGDASKVTVTVVASGDFMLSPDDQLPRRRAEKLANHLNSVLQDYYQRKGEPVAPRGEGRA